MAKGKFSIFHFENEEQRCPKPPCFSKIPHGKKRQVLVQAYVRLGETPWQE
jgi:hypothetical protein